MPLGWHHSPALAFILFVLFVRLSRLHGAHLYLYSFYWHMSVTFISNRSSRRRIFSSLMWSHCFLWTLTSALCSGLFISSFFLSFLVFSSSNSFLPLHFIPCFFSFFLKFFLLSHLYFLLSSYSFFSLLFPLFPPFPTSFFYLTLFSFIFLFVFTCLLFLPSFFPFLLSSLSLSPFIPSFFRFLLPFPLFLHFIRSFFPCAFINDFICSVFSLTPSFPPFSVLISIFFFPLFSSFLVSFLPFSLASSSGDLTTVVWWGGRRWWSRWRSGGRSGLHWISPSWWPLGRLWLHLGAGVPREWDRPCGNRLHHPTGAQSRPWLSFGSTDGEAGDVLRPAWLPPGQVHHRGPGPADPGRDVPVRAAHGVHLPGRDVPTQGGIRSTQEDLRLHQPEDEAAGDWRGEVRWGRGWRRGGFGGMRRDAE